MNELRVHQVVVEGDTCDDNIGTPIDIDLSDVESITPANIYTGDEDDIFFVVFKSQKYGIYIEFDN